MDFLLKYIKALVKSCDLEKAQKIAQDVVVALDDSQVSGALARAENIGRADKLKNILQYMKIEKLKIHDHEIEVNRAFLQKMIALRNKTFHGEGKDLQEYIQAGPKMLYLCEMILEAVRKGM